MTGARRDPDYVYVDRLGAVTILRVAGEVDVYSARHLRQALADAVVAGRTLLVLDMERLEFMDSTGTGVIVGGQKRAFAAGGLVVLAAVPEPVVKILRITGLTKVFPVYDTARSAVAEVQAAAEALHQESAGASMPLLRSHPALGAPRPEAS